MSRQFHLSLEVRALEASVDFFVRVLRASVTHRDESGYVNLDLYGAQITLTQGADVVHDLPIHFGVNLPVSELDALTEHACSVAPQHVVALPTVVDAGTAMERKKMYLRCPAGYLIELKGRG